MKLWFRCVLCLLLVLGVASGRATAAEPGDGSSGLMLTEVRKTVETSPDGVKWSPAIKGADLKVGAYLRTGPGSAAVVTYADGSKLTLGEKTQVRLSKAEGGNTAWSLLVGKVRALVKPIAQGGSHTIETHNAVVGVKGTDFVVWAPIASITVVLDLNGQVAPTCKKSEQAADLTPGTGAMCNFDGALETFQIRDIETESLVESRGGGTLYWTNWGDVMDSMASGIGNVKLAAAEVTMLEKATLALGIEIR